jgi:hypothetical protein
MSTKHYNPIDELRSLDPARREDTGEAPPELLAAILAADPLEPRAEQSPRSGHRRPPRRRLALAGAAAAVVAALTLTIGLPSGSGKHGAAAALSEVSEAAAAQSPVAADLPYRYLKTSSVFVATTVADHQAWSDYEPQIREEWAAADGSGRVRTVSEAPRFVGPGDRKAWEAAGKIPFLAHGFHGHSEEESVPAGTLRAATDVSGLPTDPTALAVRINREAKQAEGSVPVGAKMMELIAEDLGDPAASPQLRQALYEAATLIPSIQYLGAATDLSGRKGVAVGIVSSYSGVKTLYSLIYDPTTSAALATEKSALEEVSFADGEPPLVLGATVYLESGSVGTMTANPDS